MIANTLIISLVLVSLVIIIVAVLTAIVWSIIKAPAEPTVEVRPKTRTTLNKKVFQEILQELVPLYRVLMTLQYPAVHNSLLKSLEYAGDFKGDIGRIINVMKQANEHANSAHDFFLRVHGPHWNSSFNKKCRRKEEENWNEMRRLHKLAESNLKAILLELEVVE